MRVEYKAGDVIPGEGVVRQTTDPALWGTGIFLMAAGTVAFVSGTWWDVATSSVAIQGLYIAIAGGCVAAAGVGLTIAGLFPHMVVDKRVAITPIVGHGFGGGAVALRFP